MQLPVMELNTLIHDAKLTPNSCKYFASPLKMIADLQNQGSQPQYPSSHQQFTTLENNQSFINLEPVREPDVYLFGMDSEDNLNSIYNNRW